MAGGQGFTSAAGTVTPSETVALTGSAVLAETGWLGATALEGSAATSAAGDVSPGRLVRLFSRKVGAGSATHALSGLAASLSAGILVPNFIRTPVSQLLTAAQGAFGKQAAVVPIGHSSTISPGSVGVPSAEPNWIDVPNPVFAQTGIAQTYDFAAVGDIENFNSSNHQYVLTSGALPTNVTLHPTLGYQYTGSGGSSTTGLVVTVQDNYDVDWTTRSAGCLLRENFSYASLTAARSTASTSPYWGDSGAGQVSLTDEHALSGRALRLAWNSTAGANPWAWILMASGQRQVTTEYPKIYFQFIVWADELWNVIYNDGTGGDGPGTAKIVIIDRHTGSATTGELVLINPHSHGLINAYRHTGSETGAVIQRNRTLPGFTGVRQQINAIDAGGPGPTTPAEFHRRWGPANLSSITPRPTLSGGTAAAQGYPLPDHLLSGAVTWNRGGWTVVECECDATYTVNGANGRFRIWGAHYGNAPVLLMDTVLDDARGGSAIIGSRTGWSGIHFTPYVTNHLPQANLSPDIHYLDVCEVLSKTTPINFPGGFALPGV